MERAEGSVVPPAADAIAGMALFARRRPDLTPGAFGVYRAAQARDDRKPVRSFFVPEINLVSHLMFSYYNDVDIWKAAAMFDIISPICAIALKDQDDSGQGNPRDLETVFLRRGLTGQVVCQLRDGFAKIHVDGYWFAVSQDDLLSKVEWLYPSDFPAFLKNRRAATSGSDEA